MKCKCGSTVEPNIFGWGYLCAICTEIANNEHIATQAKQKEKYGKEGWIYVCAECENAEVISFYNNK